MENAINIYETKRLDSTKILLLHLFLGWSYGSMGSMGTQILFYLTCGGLGVWWLIRLFTLGSSVKEFNKKMAIESGVTSDELLKLGLI